MVGKRGLSGLAIVLILLIVIVIATILVYIFAIGGEEEPSPLSEQCAFACETGQIDSFCDVKRKVTETLSLTCNELSSSAYSSYGVQACPTVSCLAQTEEDSQSQLAPDQTCAGLEGTWETPSSDGKCPVKEGSFSRIRTAEESPPTSGQICCYYYE